ncbi:hypothetical protein HDU93_004105, partial [Gonapodya sp. JEL0774]
MLADRALLGRLTVEVNRRLQKVEFETARNEDLSTELDAARVKIGELEKRCKEWQEKWERDGEGRAKLWEIEMLKGQLSATQSALSARQVELDNLLRSVARPEKEVGTTERELARMRRAEQRWRKECAEVVARLDAEMNRSDDLTHRNDELTLRCRTIERELAETRLELDEARSAKEVADQSGQHLSIPSARSIIQRVYTPLLDPFVSAEIPPNPTTSDPHIAVLHDQSSRMLPFSHAFLSTPHVPAQRLPDPLVAWTDEIGMQVLSDVKTSVGKASENPNLSSRSVKPPSPMSRNTGDIAMTSKEFSAGYGEGCFLPSASASPPTSAPEKETRSASTASDSVDRRSHIEHVMKAAHLERAEKLEETQSTRTHVALESVGEDLKAEPHVKPTKHKQETKEVARTEIFFEAPPFRSVPPVEVRKETVLAEHLQPPPALTQFKFSGREEPRESARIVNIPTPSPQNLGSMAGPVPVAAMSK